MKAENFNYQSVSDIIIWKLEKTRMFSIKSMYSQLIKTDLSPHLKHIWKSKIPPKIKIFMWFLENNVLLIKDNLISKRWIGDASCCFCDQEEYVDHHFFFKCSISRVTWGIVTFCVNTNSIPSNIKHRRSWLSVCAPQFQSIHLVVVSAIYWVI